MIMTRSYANEPKQTENEYRQTEGLLIGAQRHMLVGYWEWDLETRKYAWNDEMYQIFNLIPQQVSLRTGTFFNCVYPADRHEVVRAFGKALVGKQPYNIEHRIVWPDGSVRFVKGKAEVTFKGGRPTRIWGIVQEVTDKRQVEEQ
jgi:PAS domain S-box-containing protein